jgi:hypothetical protein
MLASYLYHTRRKDEQYVTTLSSPELEMMYVETR